jgi:glycosyltransferase involved in cell wall biosynthesis
MKTFAVLTVCKNSAHSIKRTLDIVRRQTVKPHEFVIVDGASTDSTNKIIALYEDVVTLHVSEPDQGIGDAMNKALRLSSADYVLYLHSDDYFYDEFAVDVILSAIQDGRDIVVFDIYYQKGINLLRKRSLGFCWWINIKTTFWHQATVCSRSLFIKIGNFDCGFKIAMDYDFFLRAYRKRTTIKYVHHPISVMTSMGISSLTDKSSLERRFSEERLIHRKNQHDFLLKIIYSLWWFIYPIYRRIYINILRIDTLF